jgi:hypothetical protein
MFADNNGQYRALQTKYDFDYLLFMITIFTYSVNEKSLHLVSNPSSPVVVVFNSSSSTQEGALLIITSGRLTANSVVFSYDASNPDAFILLSGNGSVIMEEVKIRVCRILLFIYFYVHSVYFKFSGNKVIPNYKQYIKWGC